MICLSDVLTTHWYYRVVGFAMLSRWDDIMPVLYGFVFVGDFIFDFRRWICAGNMHNPGKNKKRDVVVPAEEGREVSSRPAPAPARAFHVSICKSNLTRPHYSTHGSTLSFTIQ